MRNGFILPYSPPPDQYPEFCTNYQFLKLKGRLTRLKIFKTMDQSVLSLKYTILPKNLIHAFMKLLMKILTLTLLITLSSHWSIFSSF